MNKLCETANKLVMEITEGMMDAQNLVSELEELKTSYIHIFLENYNEDDREQVSNHYELLTQIVSTMKSKMDL